MLVLLVEQAVNNLMQLDKNSKNIEILKNIESEEISTLEKYFQIGGVTIEYRK